MKYYGKIQDDKDLVTKEYVASAIAEIVNNSTIIYGFHVDGSESDPSAAITYLADAVGMTPAAMDYANSKFDWGSWRDAFFIPRPCMLKYDGTVDYYLDPNNYSKKEDGTASDVADDTYGGNAMMEWGKNGKKIWYKIIPDENDNTSASIYISNKNVDGTYHAWSFVNNQGVLADHFYTPIYNGTLDSNGKLRSISGKGYAKLCQGKTTSEEVSAAKLNNPTGMDLWYTEVYSDIILINILLILIGKSLNAQAVFGIGRCDQGSSASYMLGTGTLDNKGLFFGYNDNTHAVKVFGMENWWGNQWRRYAGHVMSAFTQKYKLTRGRQDGTTVDDYVHSGTASDYNGYLTGATGPSTNDYIKSMQFDENCFQVKTAGGTASTYWTDYWYQNNSLRYALRGGSVNYADGISGPFSVYMSVSPTITGWYRGASISCKPVAEG